MKKTYINPVMNVVKIASQIQLLAGSKVGMNNETPDEYGSRGSSDDWDWDD